MTTARILRIELRRSTALWAALLVATALVGDPMAGTPRIARDATGLTGLIGLGAAVLGASRASLLALGWTVVVVGLPVPDRRTYRVVLTWMMQPTDTTATTVTALILGATGVLAYSILGPADDVPHADVVDALS